MASRLHAGQLVYQIVDGRLAPFEPRDAQVRDALLALERGVAMTEYEDQKAQLDKAYERDAVDVFVATFGAISRDGEVRSYCTWTETVDSLLPKTELVALVRPTEGTNYDLVLADWQAITQRHPGLLQQTPDFPPRFRVTGFPTALFEELLAEKQREPA